MAWTALTFGFASNLTSSKMTQLSDNITALANGDTGSPLLKVAGFGTFSDGNEVVPLSSSTIMSAGVYFVHVTNSATANLVYVEVLINSVWRPVIESNTFLENVGGVALVFSDGTNMRFTNNRPGVSETFYYIKMG